MIPEPRRPRFNIRIIFPGVGMLPRRCHVLRTVFKVLDSRSLYLNSMRAIVCTTASDAIIWMWLHSLIPYGTEFYAALPIAAMQHMMTSSNGNIFRVTGLLCGEFTGPGEFPAQRPVARSFDVFFDLRPNKRLSKQPWGWWFETPSWSLWRQRQCNGRLWAVKWVLAIKLNQFRDRHVTRTDKEWKQFRKETEQKCHLKRDNKVCVYWK